MKKNHVDFFWKNPSIASRYRTGVSLHSHTMHSRESLGFVPEVAAHIPILAWELDRLQRNTAPPKDISSTSRRVTGPRRSPATRPTTWSGNKLRTR